MITGLILLALTSSPASTSAAEAPSLLYVRCPEDCKVEINRQRGLRVDDRQWKFENVTPGKNVRVEVSGLFNRPLFSGYVDIPAGVEATYIVDFSKRFTLSSSRDLGKSKGDEGGAEGGGAKKTAEAPPAPSVDPRKLSTLHVRCEKPCKVFVDGAEQRGSQRGIIAREVAPGKHSIVVKSVFNSPLGSSEIEISPSSEVFVVASGETVQVTSSKPLEDENTNQNEKK